MAGGWEDLDFEEEFDEEDQPDESNQPAPGELTPSQLDSLVGAEDEDLDERDMLPGGLAADAYSAFERPTAPARDVEAIRGIEAERKARQEKKGIIPPEDRPLPPDTDDGSSTTPG